MNIQRRIGLTGAKLVTAANVEHSLFDRFRDVREATEALAAPLSAEDQNLQSMPDASPVKWHRAHTTWFFETFVLSKICDYRPFHPSYSYLFNSYYEAIGSRHARPQRNLLSRPSTEEIGNYREKVDEAMLDLLASGVDAQTAAVVDLGISHEEQHQELILTDILHAFASNPLRPVYKECRSLRSPDNVAYSRSDGATAFDGGIVTIGHDGAGFAFDNENPPHEALLQPFELADRLITNGEWLEFMAAGGYREPKFWLSDGWQYVLNNSWQTPLYWEQQDGEWQSMTLAGMQPVHLDAPVSHISFYEADAFARWRGKRLPTETEWEEAASVSDPRSGNFRETGFLRPLPAGPSRQMFGDVWEWTASPYGPYPGYKAPEGAVGEYNGKFMVNQIVLRGGSCVTSREHIRASYRNFFYPHQRWQFSGVRLAENRTPRAAKATSGFLEDIWAGLSKPQKQLNSKYFYDAKGAALFEEICDLPEYYLTRTERALLKSLEPDLAKRLAPETALVEYGCGSCTKTRILFDRLQISDYVPIDICGDSLAQTSATLASDYPLLRIRPLIGDFMRPLALPEELRLKSLLGFFPGSTIGNLTDEEAIEFLGQARQTLGANGKLLIGIDLIKKPETLIAAYDDSRGVTSAFNKNVLAHINHELGADFDLLKFNHRAVWNPAEHRIEMHLVAIEDLTVSVGGRAFAFGMDETIHTENCHKYSVEDFAALAARADWSLEMHWRSDNPEFGVLLLA